jgi:hypothetical protein
MSKGNNEASAKRKRSPSKTERNVKRKVVEQEKEEPSEDLPEVHFLSLPCLRLKGCTKKIVKKNEEDEGYAVYYTPGGRFASFRINSSSSILGQKFDAP